MLTVMFPLETEAGAPLRMVCLMLCPWKFPARIGLATICGACLKFPGLAAAPAAMVGLTFMETVANKDC